MMYNQKLAVAIKSAGKVLREFKDTVYVPFGAEYSIFIKNLDVVRAVARVSIDGESVDESGEGFVIGANSSLDLERFLKGNMNKGNRFKFIERTGRIEDHRGIEVEDGLIRVEFQFEKRAPKVEYEDVHHHIRHHYHDDYWYPGHYGWPYSRPGHFYLSNTSGSIGGSGGLIGGGSAGISVGSNSLGAQGSSAQGSASNVPADTAKRSKTVANYVSISSNAIAGPTVTVASTPTMGEMLVVNEAGITVPGSISDQQFVTVSDFPLEAETHVIVLKLLGETAQGKKVLQPVTVKTKQKCPSCGHMNYATAKFCTECGTGLEIV